MSQDLSTQPPTVVDAAVATPAPRRPSTPALIGAELFGTFLLVFVGLGAGLYATTQGLGSLEIALAFGLALMAGIAAVGHVSGGHFNPAVTFGFAIAGRTPWSQVPAYLVGQLVGAAAAAAALFVTIPKSLVPTGGTARDVFSATANGFGIHSGAFATSESSFYSMYAAQGATREAVDAAIAQGQLAAPVFPEFSALQVGIIETIVTALFVGIILAVTSRKAKSVIAPIVIGLTLAVLLLIATPLSGGSLNPMRSLAAALFSDGWALSQVWLFWVAPLLGAAIAAVFYRGFATQAAPTTDDALADKIALEEEATDELDVVTTETVVIAASLTKTTEADEEEPTEVVDFVETETVVVDIDSDEDTTEDEDGSTTDSAPAGSK